MSRPSNPPARHNKPLAIEGGAPLFQTCYFRPAPVPEESVARAVAVIRSGEMFRYSSADGARSETSQLEREFADLVGARYALAVTSASSALHIALLSAGVRPGDPVLMPAFTFTAVPSAILHAQAHPLLVESDENYRVDIDDLARKMSEGARFLLLTHMRGHVADLDRITALCGAHGVTLIEDAAHSLGVTWGGVHTGTIGKLGCYSFQSDKIINGGEGGMIVTDDEQAFVTATLYSGCYETLWKKHPFGSTLFADQQKLIPAFNARMTNVTAAIVRPQLAELTKRIDICRRNHDILAHVVAQSAAIRLPDRPPKEAPVPDTIQLTLVGLSRGERLHLVEILKREGIAISIVGLDPDNARAYWNWEYLGKPSHLPKTRQLLESTCDVRLPATLSPSEAEAIGHVIVQAIDYLLARRLARSAPGTDELHGPEAAAGDADPAAVGP